MPGLKKCPDCGGKVERSKTKFIIESEKGLIAIENIGAVEKILAKKIPSHQETVFQVAAEA